MCRKSGADGHCSFQRLVLAVVTISGLLAFADFSRAAEIGWAEPIRDQVVSAFQVQTIGDPIERNGSVSLASPSHLRIDGQITPGDAETLEALLQARLPDPNSDWSNDVIVSLNSNGGDFTTGLKMADLFRSYAVGTYVGAGDRCLSSCALAFLGGSAIELRGMPAVPHRRLHIFGLLGFHAPFTELSDALTIPDGTPFSAALGRQMAGHFYGQAQSAINEIARRMENWKLTPGFVFQMLTKEHVPNDPRPLHEQFILVDRVARLEQTAAALLAPSFPLPAEIGLFDAHEACGYLVWKATNGTWNNPFFLPGELGEFTRTGPVGEADVLNAQERTAAAPEPRIVRNSQSVLVSRHLVPSQGTESFYFYGLSRGLGWFECDVFRHTDGRWYAQTFNENTHFDKPDGALWAEGSVQRSPSAWNPIDLEKPYLVDTIARLGIEGSWADPRLPPDDAAIVLAARYPEVTGASFSCSGALDAAAEVICKFPDLAVQDGIMGALYTARVAKDATATREAQRAFLALRDRACHTTGVNRGDAFGERSLGRCLRYMTFLRNRELEESN